MGAMVEKVEEAVVGPATVAMVEQATELSKGR